MTKTITLWKDGFKLIVPADGDQEAAARAQGYLEDGAEPAPEPDDDGDQDDADDAPVVAIPADWADLHHSKIMAIARAIDPAFTGGKAEAIVAVGAEVTRRDIAAAE